MLSSEPRQQYSQSLLAVIIVLQSIVLGFLAGCATNAPNLSHTQQAPRQPQSTVSAPGIIPETYTAVQPSVVPPDGGRFSSEPNATTVTFDSLLRGESYVANVENPAIYVADNAQRAAFLIQWLSGAGELYDGNLNDLDYIDFDTSYLVVVFSGAKDSGAHQIRVQDVAKNGSAIVIDVHTKAPADNASAVISHPFHAILIPKAALAMETGTQWVLTESGITLTRITMP